MKIIEVVVWQSFNARSLGLGSDAELGVAPDWDRHPGFALRTACARPPIQNEVNEDLLAFNKG